MKIIFINRFFYPDCSATSQLLTDLAQALGSDGADICVVTSRQLHDDPSVVLSARERVGNVNVYRVWTSWFGRKSIPGRAVDYMTFYISAFICLLRITCSGDVVVAETDPPLISIVAAVMAKIKKARLVNWIQDLFPEVARQLGVKMVSGVRFRALKGVRNWALCSAENNIVLGESMKATILAEGVPNDKINIIHNWADDASIIPIERTENPLRTEWKLDGKFVVGYSGNFGLSHDFSTILSAAVCLKQVRDVVFLFIGGGARLEEVQQFVIKHDLKNVLFREYQPRNRLVLSLSVPDVHLVTLTPALEGMIVPSKLYGIAAAGRPVIFVGSRDGEVSRIIANGGMGFAVDEGDAEGLTRYIMLLRDDTRIWNEISHDSRKTYESDFTFMRALGQWKGVLAEVCELEPQVR